MCPELALVVYVRLSACVHFLYLLTSCFYCTFELSVNLIWQFWSITFVTQHTSCLWGFPWTMFIPFAKVFFYFIAWYKWIFIATIFWITTHNFMYSIARELGLNKMVIVCHPDGHECRGQWSVDLIWTGQLADWPILFVPVWTESFSLAAMLVDHWV